MRKWVSWAVRVGATALLLSFLCIWTTGYIVNSYVESVIKQLDLPIETKPIALSGIWGTLWGVDDPESGEEAQSSETPEIVENTDLHSSSISSGEETTANADNPSDSPAGEDDVTDGEVSPPPSPSDEATTDVESDGPGNGAIPVMGEAEENQLTDEQRQRLYGGVVAKLDPDQLNLLSEALEGGMTPSELAAVGEMLKEALTDEEYEQMMGVLQGTEVEDAAAQ